MLYFAYGSNMDWNRMRERCPSARFLCIAYLQNHRFRIGRKSKDGTGKADAVHEAGARVWGVVFEVADTDIGTLDRSEGFQPGRQKNAYVRVERHVHRDNDPERPLAVCAYLVSHPDESPPPPSAEYRGFILSGARQWHLPAEYIQQLEAEMPLGEGDASG